MGKEKEEKKDNSLKYKIIKTGSKGNAVIIEDMLIDCGVTFKEIKEELYNIKYLIITHIHSDHLNKSTIKKIRDKFPRVKIIGNWSVGSKIYVDYMVGDETSLDLKDRTIQSFLCPHDVVCHGFVIDYKGKKIIYATDTKSLENAPDEKYDYLFLESNHDEKKINAVMFTGKKKYGYDVFENAKRHLSTKKAKEFYYTHRKSKESKFIELHQSLRFY